MKTDMNITDLNDNGRVKFLQNFVGKHLNEGVSQVTSWLNGKLLSVENGQLSAEFIVREDMCNPMKVLHGGIAATILDDVAGTMVYAMGREFAYTSVNLNCDYLHAARIGDVLIATAKIIRAGKNIVHVEAVIKDAENRIIAKCTTNLIQTSLKISS